LRRPLGAIESWFSTLTSATLLALTLFMAVHEAPLRAQSAGAKAPAAQSPTPQWQIDAGGKMEFDVASVKQDTAAPSPSTRNSNIPLGPQDAFSPTGGLLSSTNWPLSQYMVFAYKLTPAQFEAVQSALPKWANSDRYDIQARASGNPTKDQFRLMMQALLADRFKLAIHYETKQLPVMALVLDKPGKLGPKIQPHPSDAPCSTAPLPPGAALGAIPTVAGGFPEPCGALVGWPSDNPPGRLRLGGRNVPIAMFSTLIDNPATGIDRPVLDKTELEGKFDFIMEFTPQFNGPLPPGANFTPDPSGPTFQEALKEQLGLKLAPQTGPVDVIVIDHVEEPSVN
jgi:uncharacterized protein (TIGR03435 family)